MKDISEFIKLIADIPPLPNSVNIYSHNDSANRIRRSNLRIYLEQMASLNTDTLLVGEAPGYQGCRLTGIPFTSEYIMLNGVENYPVFGREIGYEKTKESEIIKKEPSATIVWNTINNFHLLPLIWSAYPFHPHKPGIPNSNRKPIREEMKIGLPILQQIINLFSIQNLIAVGITAAQQLDNLSVPFEKVRHPSHGGKPEFVRGLKKIFKTNQKRS